ncbi:MAG: DUF4091 domain-containing protein [Armatimonadetes bacterium]|nr:DUF4091 domain-containing protein [Armatimonadota bacterium]
MRTVSMVVLLTFSRCPAALAQPVSVPNPGFEEGAAGMPAGWTLSGGEGTWDSPGRGSTRCVSVTSETGSNFWRTGDVVFDPGGLYRVSVWMKTLPGTSGGCIITGPPFANRDYNTGAEWTPQSFVFSAPEAPRNQGFLRLGQWEVRGTVLFDDAGLVPVQALHKRLGDLELGAGESIDQGRYRARPRFDDDGSNHSRCLYRNDAGFNSNRWVLSGDAAVTYRHRVGDYEQTAAHCKVNCGWHASGALVAEAGPDGVNWVEIGRADKVGRIEADLPETLLPARDVFIRLRCEGEEASLQVHGYEYEADLAGNPPDLQGRTSYLELTRPNEGFTVASLGDLVPGGGNRVALSAADAAPPGALAIVEVVPEAGEPYRNEVRLARGVAELPYEVPSTGRHTLRISVRVGGGGEPLYEAVARFTVPDMYAANYGYVVSHDDAATVWWCESPYKISRERPAPTETRPSVLIEAARNEYEAAQVVVRPSGDLSGFAAAVSDLTGPRGAKIPASAIEIDEVAYVNVRIPTDNTGCEGWWPDPLPPLTRPLDLAGGRNQPLWVTAHVPKDIPAGDYQGTLTLTAAGWQKAVDLRVHVFDFTLPDETHVESGFGLDVGPLREYHNLTTNEEVRQVYDLYLRNFAAHRISPYNPTPFDPIRVTFTGVTWEGGRFVTDQRAEGEASLQIVDDSETASVGANLRELIPIDPQKSYALRWACRTGEPGQEYLVTLQTYDGNRQWISGNNKDLAATGSGEWQAEERDLTGRFDDRVRFAQLVLRPAMWTEDGSKTGTAWFDECAFVAAEDGNNLLPNAGFETTDEQLDVEVDFTDWDRAAAYAFDELHLRSFALPVQGMGGGTFHSRYLGRIGPYEQGTPEYERLMAKYLTTVQNHLEAKGWLDRQYIYWFDEPDAKDYDFVRDGMALLDRCAPKLRRMLTEEPTPPLFGAVDLWCPLVPSMDPTICAERKAQGEDIWWYVCTGPKAPFPTLFIDHNAIEMRLWLWMTWKWDIDGVLIWATNYWHSPAAYYEGKLQNPWDDPMSYVSGYDYQAGQIGYWGNGDGRFVYPPNRRVGEDRAKYLEGPVNCLRWEMLRDGIEDYECFYLLRSLTEKGGAQAQEAAKLLAIPEAIIPDATHFTRDPQPMLEHRRKVAEAIERLQ